MALAECVEVYLRDGERARRALASSGLLAPYKPRRMGDRLLLPVTSPGEALSLLDRHGIRARICRSEFEEYTAKKTPKPPLSYVMVGDIIIVNPRRGVEDLSYYKGVAEEFLSHVKRARSVYLKVGTHGVYRTAKLVHLAGIDDTRTIHREYGLRFHVDLAKVYFNPRLASERARIAGLTSDGERVLDMFSGAGGYSIHVASRSSTLVLAVDINHYAAAYAAINVRANRQVMKGRVAVLRADAYKLPRIHAAVFDRVIMDNPTNPSPYAPIACKMLSGKGAIHYYTLTISKNEAADEASNVFTHACRKFDIMLVREVLEYSPEYSVYVVDLEAEK
ncbi:MAG: class I SAM-dependent methyltransferase family protein [Desulfurococcales archaeon]|nr:class I SAM-dependent methyltransferase family protein [Desulfurococcales archaeon]